MKITIKRPAGDFRPFERLVTLVDPDASGNLVARRYRLQVWPSARPGGGLWSTWLETTGAVLVRSLRLVPAVPDLFAPFRARVAGLPPGTLRVDADFDPQLTDLAGDEFALLYNE